MDQREQKNIFKLFLGQISRDDVILEPIESWLKDEYDDLKFNGRQIRNIVSSAMDLARAENQKLQLKHVKKMWNCTRAFQSYLKEQTIRAKDRAE
jgi:predicted ATP-dependent protease